MYIRQGKGLCKGLEAEQSMGPYKNWEEVDSKAKSKNGWNRGSHSAIPGLAASRDLLEMQGLRPRSRSTKSEAGGGLCNIKDLGVYSKINDK